MNFYKKLVFVSYIPLILTKNIWYYFALSPIFSLSGSFIGMPIGIHKIKLIKLVRTDLYFRCCKNFYV